MLIVIDRKIQSDYLLPNITNMRKNNKDLFVLKVLGEVWERNASNHFILTRKCIFVESHILR